MELVSSALQLFLVIFSFVALAGAQTAPVVETTLGRIKGSILKTEKGLDINAFRGIKYAEAPVGEKRFKAPVAVTKWEGEMDATKDGFMCPQAGASEDWISEDCLSLNVYSGDLNGSKSVIVYIHGGANKGGSSHSEREVGPEYLMDSDIVFVSLNYRLGAFGFLTTRTADAPGNFGYLDQVMALQWVHDHISKFGGNPMSVTISGESAGAMAVTLHLASPLSRGLFHGAIALSGSATHEQTVDNLYWTRRLAHETSCPMFNPVNVLACLRELKWQTIVNTSTAWDVYFGNMNFNYEVDGHFLDFRPTTYFANGNFSRVPIIAGFTLDEFSFVANVLPHQSTFLKDVSMNFEKYAPELFSHDFGNPPSEKANQIKSFYLKDMPINSTNLLSFGLIFSDSAIAHGVHRLVDLARKYVNVYYYRFDYPAPSPHMNGLVSHSDDLNFIFKFTNYGGQIGVQDKEWFMVERMVEIFSTFAQRGTPPDIDNVEWIPSNSTKVSTLFINETVSMNDEPFVERFELWDRLFPVRSGSGSLCGAYVVPLIVSVLSISRFVR